jgi:hypothetical protein
MLPADLFRPGSRIVVDHFHKLSFMSHHGALICQTTRGSHAAFKAVKSCCFNNTSKNVNCVARVQGGMDSDQGDRVGRIFAQ